EIADPSGALRRGRAEADNPGALIVRFREQGRFVLSVRPAGKSIVTAVGARAMALGAQRGFRRLFGGVGLNTLLLFTGQLAAMLAGGPPLARILTSLAAESTSKRFRNVLDSVRDAITAGSSFADALDQHPHVFDRLYV